MAFNHVPIYAELTSAEENLLEKIDAFHYPLVTKPELLCVGDLHKIYPVIVVGNVPGLPVKTRTINIKLTDDELNNALAKINKEIDRIKQILEPHQIDRDGDRPQGQHVTPEQQTLLDKLNKLRDMENIFSRAQKDPTDRLYKISKKIIVLGEFDPINKVVILYIDNIRKHGRYEQLATTYVHEMMHAAFDCKAYNYYREIEEPITEYSMLKFFESYTVDPGIFDFASYDVGMKRFFPEMSCYGFGYGLFNNRNIIDWTLDHFIAKWTSFIPNTTSIQYVDAWKDGVYPFDPKDEADRIKLLYDALHKTTRATTIINGIVPTPSVTPNRNDFQSYLQGLPAPHTKTPGSANSYHNSLNSSAFILLAQDVINSMPKFNTSTAPTFTSIYNTTDLDILLAIDDRICSCPADPLVVNALITANRACRSALPYYVGYLRTYGYATFETGQQFHLVRGIDVAQ